MKDLFKNGVIVLLIIAALYIIFLRECKHVTPCIQKDEMIIKKSVWDSVQKIASLQPIIKYDTIWKEGKPQTVHNAPKPKPEIVYVNNDTIRKYSDTLKNEGVNVVHKFSIKGTLLDNSWEYTPTFVEMKEEVIKYVPKIVEKPVSVPVNGLFLYGVVGGNGITFIPGVGINFITKKNTQIGYQYLRYDKVNFHFITLGAKISFKRKG